LQPAEAGAGVERNVLNVVGVEQIDDDVRAVTCAIGWARGRKLLADRRGCVIQRFLSPLLMTRTL